MISGESRPKTDIMVLAPASQGSGQERVILRGDTRVERDKKRRKKKAPDEYDRGLPLKVPFPARVALGRCLQGVCAL